MAGKLNWRTNHISLVKGDRVLGVVKAAIDAGTGKWVSLGYLYDGDTHFLGRFRTTHAAKVALLKAVRERDR